MPDSFPLAAALLALGLVLIVGARRVARSRLWRVHVTGRGYRRLSPFGQRLIFIHLELAAGTLVAAALSLWPRPAPLGVASGWLVFICCTLNVMLLCLVTTPAILLGAATVNPEDLPHPK